MMFTNQGGAEVLHLDGSKINWHNPPKANAKVQWSRRDTSGRRVTGSFRTIAHINRLNNLTHHKFGKPFQIIQPPFNTSVPASAGTHDYDACIDCYIPGVGWYTAQHFLRANGLGCWVRKPPLFPYHIHGFTIPPQSGKVRADDFRDGGFKVGLYVDGGITLYGNQRSSSQLVDYYQHKNGLASHAADNTWHPDPISKTIFNLANYVKARQS